MRYNQLMVIPEFPRFREVDLSCRNTVNTFLSKYPLEASEYTFTNIYAFRKAYNFKISRLKNNLLILKNTEPVSLFCPMGSSHVPEVLTEIFDYLKTVSREPHLERVPESFVTAYLNEGKKYFIEEDRNQFDYIYNVKELIELKGRKFHDKKNQVNNFRSRHTYEYLILTPDLIEECLEFEDYWCEVKECGKHAGLERERCAILVMLNNFEVLNIKGGAIRVDNKIAALTLGEKMLPDTFVVHVEKANSDIHGLYQVINQEFLIHEAGDCTFVNREQDMGVQGLRKAKMSYNPVRFVKKYRVRENERR
ncbi:MAG: DUF2156 domain-containing protein [Thermodesulfovibrionia bacterium]|nr:DUF2156 domain-containing protein [Thermodesulfovibrionia bacterium]